MYIFWKIFLIFFNFVLIKKSRKGFNLNNHRWNLWLQTT